MNEFSIRVKAQPHFEKSGSLGSNCTHHLVKSHFDFIRISSG